jgi:Fe-S cluster biogenesis protein NfuA
VAPQPAAPTGTLSTLTPVFKWSGGSGAANYEINVRDLSTKQIVVRQRAISTSSTSFAMPAGSLTYDRSYAWDITACPDASCSSGYVVSSNLNFTTLKAPPPANYSLAISFSGTGLVGYGGGLTCASACTPTYNSGAVAVLTATPAQGNVFVGWTGACSGTGNCVLTMDAGKSVTATFAAAAVQQHLLTMVTTGGAGSGSITYAYGSSRGTCSAGNTCQGYLASGTVIDMTASAASGSSFAGWSGACSGASTCSVTLNSAKSVTANFSPVVAPRPVVTLVSPNPLVLNGNSQTLVVSGNSFSSGNVLQFAESSGPVAGIWSTPFPVVVGTGQVSMLVTADSVPGTYYVRVCRSESATAVADCSAGTQLLTITSPPDLAPTDFGFTFGYNASTGRWTNMSVFSFQVVNLGGSAAAATTTRFEFRNSAGALVLTANLATPGIAAGSAYSHSSFFIPLDTLAAGQYSLSVIVDALRVSGQINLANDAIKKSIPLN